MAVPQRSLATQPWFPVVLVAALAASNVLTNRVLPRSLYAPWCIAMSVGLLVAARRAGVSWASIGLDRRDTRRGLQWGGVLVAGVAVTYLIGLALPPTRHLFEDRRADGSWQHLLINMFFAVPFGTALLEEVAFRGVLPAVFQQRWTSRRSIAVSAALFGLWHVLPSWTLARANTAVRAEIASTGGRITVVVGAVLSTAIVGVFFSWLRARSKSLLTPYLLHVATNSLGYLAAWLYLRA